MKRAHIVLGSTAVGTAAVLAFHPQSPSLASATTPTVATSTGKATTKSPRNLGPQTATGAAMNTRYGRAQVKVTVSRGKIVKLEAVQLQHSDPHSKEISSGAAAMLQQSVLAKQTAAVDTVSGATYTSLSYKASLQSALDKLGYKAPDGSKASTDVTELQ
jgi:uncharacterized protein with FMN-binding domain